MGRRTSVAVAGALASLLVFAGAADASKWVGKATNLKGDFNYGKVTFTVKGGFIRNLTIRAVTTKSDEIPFTTVVLPKAKITGGTFFGRKSYPLLPGDMEVVEAGGTIRGSVAKGRFNQGPLIDCEGKFTTRKQ